MVEFIEPKVGEITEVSEDLFDDRGGYEEESPLQIAHDLTDLDKHHAKELYRLFNGIWGVCIVAGDPGVGKDLFGNYLTWQMKHLFPWKRLLRDERPRKLFGEYAGLFNDRVLKDDLLRMKSVARERRGVNLENGLEVAADKWVASKGEVMLRNSIIYLTELWRYCYSREPHSPMNKTLGSIFKMKRHLDCFIIGTVQSLSELDKKTLLAWVDWRVTCSKSRVNPTGFGFFVQQVKYDRQRDEFISMSHRPYSFSVDAGVPKTKLGDGKIKVVRADYHPENEEERVVLTVLKAGYNIYEDVVDLLETKGDMSEKETLRTLKELKFRKSKRCIDFPCWFSLYNSKSAPQIDTRIKSEGG